MDRLPVDSEAIASFGYDPEEQVLEVEFVSGRVYQYFGVHEEVLDDMRHAESLGEWFNLQFKPAGYPYRELIRSMDGGQPPLRPGKF
jgi:hypothetical protein